ncbi:MAG: hypothetical protein ACREIC_22605 [Limisphaerales bacterium]
MNSDSPLNPSPLPDHLNLDAHADAAGRHGQPGGDTSAHKQSTHARRGTRPKRPRSAKGGKNDYWAKWERIKGRLTARLILMDQEKLKRVLMACGIAAGVVLLVMLAVKLMPVALTILVLLGLGMALKVWDRLRVFPLTPF